MYEVVFEDQRAVEDSLFRYAVIVSRYRGQWIYCRHRDRETWEIPGGHREPDEPILATARRELYEETGALAFELTPVCAFHVTGSDQGYGLLCFAEVRELGDLPGFEIRQVLFFNQEPAPLTYPQIQPALLQRVIRFIAEDDATVNAGTK
ncbi:MAG: NUDIX domain-containing protein [Eubacteriales bacterium]|nr:NUDIX domain-containing protein [Eubacteriales bacterium]